MDTAITKVSKEKKYKFHSPKDAIDRIERCGGMVTGKGVYAPVPGLKTWSAIDFLVNYHGFYFSKVAI